MPNPSPSLLSPAGQVIVPLLPCEQAKISKDQLSSSTVNVAVEDAALACRWLTLGCMGGDE